MGIKTLLDTMFITLQNGKERDWENPSGHIDNATPLFNKGKARKSTLQEQRSRVFDNWMKTPIGITRVYDTPFMTTPRLPREDWEQYMACIMV